MRPFGIIPTLIAIMALCGCGGKADSRASTKSDDYLKVQGRIDVSDIQDRPEIVFPKEVRSDDESLNAFLQHFTEVCLAGEYDEYRLLVSRQIEPVSKQQFEKTYRRVEYVEINLICDLPKISELPYPLWLIESIVHIRQPTEEPLRRLQVLIFKENEKWVMAPAPRALRQALAATSQPVCPPANQPAKKTDQALAAQATSPK